jgi:hypothetical protein
MSKAPRRQEICEAYTKDCLQYGDSHKLDTEYLIKFAKLCRKLEIEQAKDLETYDSRLEDYSDLVNLLRKELDSLKLENREMREALANYNKHLDALFLTYKLESGKTK